jgi:glycosyltransferase involved in cell wall biosynthesis
MDLDLILPTYNRAHLLKNCLDSILRASRPTGLQINVVVVDNNSKDDTKSVVQAYIDRDVLPIRYIFVERAGKSAALNEAIAQTGAELIGLIDDDEQIDSAWFEVAYREFFSTRELDYIGGPCRPNWEQGAPDWFPSGYGGIVGIVPRPERVAFSQEFNGMLMGGNAVIRRATLERVLPYPEHLGKIGNKIRSGEDEVIYHRLLEIAAKGMVVPDLIIYHWIPADRLTKSYCRQWAIGRGISEGSQLRERGFVEPGLFGIQRYKFGIALQGMKKMLFAKPQKERFAAQLSVLDCFATLYGRYFY